MYAASSREALDGARVELEAALRGAKGADATTVGTELLSFADTVSDNRTLRTALADSATAPDARADIAKSLLDGKVAPATRDTVASAAARQWSNDGDLARGLRTLGREALLQSAKDSGNLDTVEEELFGFAQLVKGDPELEQALKDRTRTAADREQLVKTLLNGKVDPVTEALAAETVASTDEAPGDALDQLSELAAGVNGRKVAYVSSAGELSAKQRTDLAAKLPTIYGAPVTLHVEVDPDLLGGVVVRVGDERIDGSVAGRLAELRRNLK
ncbi:MAG: F0F1 ATP synthase subunit delta [Gordonia sp. (in: high G+C Gram-positive bacteria)]|uniref:F0F1 ATP synthase subunit delta n=1 Tax=Gordonia sp. (in: high G+C Gram-positive bacteria) TaxID=84139 RepID=UPI0039E6287F